MSCSEEFLQYAEEETHPVGKYQYSNLGLLLVGLSPQHLAKDSFDNLLHSYIISPANEDAKVNPSDPTAEHLTGCPAGGYWTSSIDLCKFGA